MDTTTTKTNLTRMHVLAFKRQAATEDEDTMPVVRLPSKRMPKRKLTDDDPTPYVAIRPILYPW